MKQKKYFYSVVVFMLAVALSGCKKEVEPGPLPVLKHFIVSYCEPPLGAVASARVVSHDGTEPVVGVRTRLFFESQGDYSVVYSPGAGPWPSAEESRRAHVFDSLARAHQDTEFNRRSRGFINCQYKQISRIDVVSDTDYDLAHPAGTPLNDLLDIHFFSAEDYLVNGYQLLKYIGQTTRENSPGSGSYLRESLTEFNQIQRKLIKFGFAFSFNSLPERQSARIFTITYTTLDGHTVSAQTGPVQM